ncbi:FecR family protein [Desertivirga arenae]|uniref:FecR family protein n=1 Tax=Desertivirga arenae TaxID=2810309 RepID=UPI001A95D8B2|nr:FecR domain-containing protein [Pedobacter sp. SYSU D00823]
MKIDFINSLIEKYKNRTATKEERDTLLDWYRKTAEQDAEFPEEEEIVQTAIWERLKKDIGVQEKKRVVLWPRLAAAAAIVVALTAGLLFKQGLFGGKDKAANTAVLQEIGPGGNKAVLILADGSRISLNDVKNGEIADQGSIKIRKTADGQLIYIVEDQKQGSSAQLAYNTIETPRGGQYQLQLPDGSKVWLNAASSLRFPVNFSSSNERRVALNGEAYFEVAKDKLHPFKVNTDQQEVEVLGTHFNINSFRDEGGIKTTLLEGSVKVLSGSKSATLVPGQQAEVAGNITVKNVNTEDAMAWRNGYFRFDDESLENIMKKISRWYDVDVVYIDEGVKDEQFAAVAKRTSNASALLKMMEQTGNVRFEIKGSQILVRKR